MDLVLNCKVKKVGQLQTGTSLSLEIRVVKLGKILSWNNFSPSPIYRKKCSNMNEQRTKCGIRSTYTSIPILFPRTEMKAL